MTAGTPIRYRAAGAADAAASRALVLAAFWDNEPKETAAFLDAMRIEGCILGEWLAEDATGPLAHVVFSRVWLASDIDTRVDAAMLTPLAVRPDRQRSGLGTALTEFALASLDRCGETLFFVLGHPSFYPRVGFRADLAAQVDNPWGRTPAFMARCATRPAGRLVLPKSIADAH